MALFKKLTSKIVTDVKETVAEEAKNTGKDIKEEIVERASDILPVVAAFVLGIVICAVFKRSQPPVTVVLVK